MGWLRTRRARKKMEAFFGKEYTDNVIAELKEGTRAAETMRDELRKLESPEYVRLIETLNAIKAGTAPDDQKYLISKKLIERSTLIDRERNDLAEQVEMLYNSN